MKNSIIPIILLMILGIACVSPEDIVTFPDPNLDAAIRNILNKEEGNFTKQELANILELDLKRQGISDLTGLEYFVDLSHLYLAANNVEDVTPVGKLEHLIALDLIKNKLSDISPLANLKNLLWLDLGMNSISDLSPLQHLKKLETLSMDMNKITDISPLKDLPNLKLLSVSGMSQRDFYPDDESAPDFHNQISDITTLENLKTLTNLALDDNEISDISSLSRLSELKSLNLKGNEINNLGPLKDLKLEKLIVSDNNMTIKNDGGQGSVNLDIVKKFKSSDWKEGNIIE